MEQKAISSDLIRGHIDTIILYALIESDKFAQQISDSIEQKSNGEYKMIQATLYSSLKRLESLKYVSSYWYDSTESSGRRKYFKITDLGKATVKNNLDNWSYSRALIDTLVDCSPQPIYKTQYVEKIVEVPSQGSIAPIVSPETQNKKDILSNNLFNQNTSILNEKIDKPNENINFETKQDINFRNILSGLIKATQPKKQEKLAVEPIVKDSNIDEKLKFNETISTVDYNAQKAQNNGKIDFGDLVIKAAQEGYKVRISSKDSSVAKGKLLINKLNFCSALSSYFLFAVQFLLIFFIANSVINFSTLSVILISVAATIYPITASIVYFLNPEKKTNKLIFADSILTVSIIIFNLILITFAGNLIFGVDFSNTFSLLVYLVMPIIVYLDALIYFVIKYYLAKLKFFNIIQK